MVSRVCSVSVFQRAAICVGTCLLGIGIVRGESGDYLGPLDVIASPDQTLLYVVQFDVQRIDVVDVATHKVVRNISLPAEPRGLAVRSDGSLLYVTCGGYRGTVWEIESATGKALRSFPAGHTPGAPVLLPGGKRLFVCNRFTDDVSVIDLEAGKEVGRVAVLREPVSAAATPDGSLVLVANLLPVDPSDADHVAAGVSIIRTADLTTSTIRLPNGTTGLYGVCVSPDGKHAYAVHLLSRYRMPTTQLERGWMNTNALSVIDVANERLINTVLLDEIDLGAANPYAVKTSADGSLIFVSHAGTHEVSAINAPGLLEKLAAVPKTTEEARAQGRTSSAGAYASATVVDVPNDLTFLVDLRDRIRLRKQWLPGWTTQEGPRVNGPRGLDVIGSKVYVTLFFSDALAVIDLENPRYDKVTILPLGPEPALTMERKGLMYFHDADICFQQWQSCASCHPDARVDGLNWDLLNDGIGNPKNTKSMLLSHQTPPSMSLGVRATAEETVRAGIRHIQFAVPPEEEQVPESIDEYLKALEIAPSPYLVEGELSESAERGKGLFFSNRIGCASCHPAPLYTDLKTHDVGSRGPFDRSDAFDTPALIETWRGAPFLHTGEFTTVKDLIKVGNHGGRVGDLKSLTEQELADLVEFVLSL